MRMRVKDGADEVLSIYKDRENIGFIQQLFKLLMGKIVAGV